MQVVYLVQHNQIVLAHTVTVCLATINYRSQVVLQDGMPEAEAAFHMMLDQYTEAAHKFGQQQTKAVQKLVQLT
jgi:hypothetical protein